MGQYRVPSTSPESSAPPETPQKGGWTIRVASASPSTRSVGSPDLEGAISNAADRRSTSAQKRMADDVEIEQPPKRAKHSNETVPRLIATPRARTTKSTTNAAIGGEKRNAIDAPNEQPSKRVKLCHPTVHDIELRPAVLGFRLSNETASRDLNGGNPTCSIAGLWHRVTADRVAYAKGSSLEMSGVQTLQDIIDKATEATTDIPTKRGTTGLPESFLWHSLIALLSIVHYSQTGQTTKSPGRQGGWWTRVHNMIDPSNVFYQPAPSGSANDVAPTCNANREQANGETRILGNWSCSAVQFDGIGDGDGLMDEVATAMREDAFEEVRAIGEETGFEAPEIFHKTRYYSTATSSDLWSVGAVMVALMTGRTVWDIVLERVLIQSARRKVDRYRLHERWQDDNFYSRYVYLSCLADMGEIALALPCQYSGGLKMLVEGMLVCDPQRRGQAIEVLLDADNLLKAWLAKNGHDKEKTAS